MNPELIRLVIAPLIAANVLLLVAICICWQTTKKQMKHEFKWRASSPDVEAIQWKFLDVEKK